MTSQMMTMVKMYAGSYIYFGYFEVRRDERSSLIFVCHHDLLGGGGEGGGGGGRFVAFFNAVVLAVVSGRCVIIVGAVAAAPDAHDSSQCRRASAVPSHGNTARRTGGVGVGEADAADACRTHFADFTWNS